VKFNLRRLSSEWFKNQIKLNSVAIVSLITAIAGLTYNTWQSHQNEVNQNMRVAAFEVLKNLGELQTVVNYAHYDGDNSRGNPIEGWKHVTMVRDLSHLLNAEAEKQGQALFTQWERQWEKLDEDSFSETQISAQIAKTRRAVLSNIDALE
jgi:hypothetical protein